MVRELHEDFAYQLETLIGDYNKSRHPTYMALEEIEEFMTRSLAAIERITTPNSVYYLRARRAVIAKTLTEDEKLTLIMGVIRGLHSDVNNKFTQRARTIIRGEVFDDFLEMAKHLSDEGYKDAAAVIAGSSLESQLRQLSINHGLDIEIQTKSGTRPAKADLLNANLAKSKIYSVLDQKSVVAWLELRNSAAHGNYNEYTEQEVSIMIDGVRNFIARNPQ